MNSRCDNMSKLKIEVCGYTIWCQIVQLFEVHDSYVNRICQKHLLYLKLQRCYFYLFFAILKLFHFISFFIQFLLWDEDLRRPFLQRYFNVFLVPKSWRPIKAIQQHHTLLNRVSTKTGERLFATIS